MQNQTSDLKEGKTIAEKDIAAVQAFIDEQKQKHGDKEDPNGDYTAWKAEVNRLKAVRNV